MDIYKMADGSLPVSLSWSFKMTTVSNALPWGHCVHIIKIPTQRTDFTIQFLRVVCTPPPPGHSTDGCISSI